jgi:hypothetical protein
MTDPKEMPFLDHRVEYGWRTIQSVPAGRS